MKRLDGRDKINMLIQECAKLAAFVLMQNGTFPEMADKLVKLGNGLSLCRSGDRFLNASIPFEGLIKAINSEDAGFVKTLKMLICIGYIIFFYYDNKIFLGQLGVFKKLDYADLGTKASKLWFYCLVMTILLQILEMQSKKAKSKYEEEQRDLSIYGNCCDVIVAAHGSGYIGGSEAMKNVLLIMSALIGLKRISKQLQ